MTHSLKVLLVGNYKPDGQHSMHRFTGILEAGLVRLGIDVEVFLPPVLLGRMCGQGSSLGKWLGYCDKFLLFPFILRRRLRQLRRRRNMLVHVCDHSNAPYVHWLRHVPHVVTCHDLLAVRSACGEFSQNPTRWSGKLLQRIILSGLKASRCTVSVSESTRSDLIRFAGSRPEWSYLIPVALDEGFLSEANTLGTETERLPSALPNLPEGSRYIMHIGGDKWYKNRSGVLSVFAKIAGSRFDVHLIAVGNSIGNSSLEESECSKFSDRIHSIGGISDSDLRVLYKGAELLLFPSLMEGFGWPILEAQACGCPVATLDRAPMSELNASKELLLDVNTAHPGWAGSAANQCLAALARQKESKSANRKDLKAFAARFSIDSMISSYVEVYEAVLSQKPTR